MENTTQVKSIRFLDFYVFFDIISLEYLAVLIRLF